MISPAHLNAIFARRTAIISLIMAAETIVPEMTAASDGSIASCGARQNVDGGKYARAGDQPIVKQHSKIDNDNYKRNV